MEKRFCQASENNKVPILGELKKHFSQRQKVLEIGTGTGQHAVYFAQHLDHLLWQTSDVPINHDSALAWMQEAGLQNVLPPLPFTVGQDPWPSPDADAVFTANTAHIMQPFETKLMMELVADHLPSGGVFCQYGPFNLNGQYTSEGNLAFDHHLLNEGCGGIRDVCELQEWAAPLSLIERVQMPANNFLLVWRK